MKNNLDNLVIGYVFEPDGSYKDIKYFKGTPENIASFIVTNQFNKTVITDDMDRLITSSLIGGFIHECPDQAFLVEKLHPEIIPLQLGEKEPVEIDFIDEADLYSGIDIV